MEGYSSAQRQPTPEDRTLTSSEEPAKFIIRNGEPIAVYKKNGILRLYKLKEATYEEISEIIEPSLPKNIIKQQNQL